MSRVMRWRLKKDFVIPAGTLLDDVGLSEKRGDDGWGTAVVGLTNDTHGYFVYDIEGVEDGSDEELCEWIERVEP